ncbi:hypothetical protein [Bacillus sp. UNC438CL73TsuS30]|uniref:hypothetical protein n=1 Tax=Bacillus sp. UNC438CL73TsuS30 TaxID=1340434 RepID=UPI00047A1BE2|nr:hypothetical protein [Bacillus sp. UNC438CL73TsuS30]
MNNGLDKLQESKNIISKIANGLDPINNIPIHNDSFLNDPKIIRSLFFLINYIESEITKNESPTSTRKKSFKITQEQKSKVIFPEGKIGVNDLAKAINDVIDTRVMKRINGSMINKQLKKMGILSEIKNDNGNTRTITNGKSEGYGIVTGIRFFENRQYEQVLFNDMGKEFLLKNLEKILEFK